MKATVFLLAFALGMTVSHAYDTPQAAIDAASKFQKEKKFDQAHQCLEEGFKLAVNPTERFLVLMRRAELYKTQGNWAEAEKMLKQIIDDTRTTPQFKSSAWLRLAAFKEMQKKPEDAIEAYQNVLEICKEGNPAQEALIKCGNLLIQVKDYSSAIECFKKVLTVPNKDARRAAVYRFNSYTSIARVYEAMKQFPAAVKTLEDAAALPEFKSAANQQALRNAIYAIYERQIREHIRFRKFDDAAAALSDLKKRDSSPRTIGMEILMLNGKAAAAARLRKFADAEAFYRQAVEIKGANPSDLRSAWSELINLYLRQGKTAEAEKALQSLMALPRKDAEDEFWANECKKRYLCGVKKYDDAIEVMKQTAELKGMRPFRVARCYEIVCQIYLFEKKDNKSALIWYKKAEQVPGANWKSPYLKKKIGL